MNSVFVMADGINKFTIDSVVEKDGSYFIHIDSDVSKNFIPGKYAFQILNSEGLEKQDNLKVTPNLLYSQDISSYWRKVLKQVEDRIAGKSIDSANAVTVDGKSISYMSLSELFKLRDFALNKIAEEEEEEGIETSSPSDEHRIKYEWSGL